MAFSVSSPERPRVVRKSGPFRSSAMPVCAVCGGPVIRAAYNQPTHVDFRVKTHEAKI